jgi:hypothetical protein
MEIKIFLLFHLFSLILSESIELDFSISEHQKISPSENLEIINGESIFEEFSLSGQNIVMHTNICLGSPKQCFNLVVDSGSFDLWVTDKNCNGSMCSTKRFKSDKSSTFSKKSEYEPQEIQYGIGRIEGSYYKDKVTIGKLELSDFQFMLVDKVEEFNSEHEGILGMGYKYSVNKTDDPQDYIENSLLDQLFKQGKINDNIFTQKFSSDRSGKMLIGEMPKEIENDMEKYGFCDVANLTSFWRCKMDGVFYGWDDVNSMKNITKAAYVLFDTGTNFIEVPQYFLKELKNSYLKKQYDNSDCWDVEQGGFINIVCNSSGKSSIEDINFVFGDWVIKMRKSDLFRSTGFSKYQLIIASSGNSMGGWIFGTPVLKKFHMVFRKNPDKIGFYGDDVFDKSKPFKERFKTVYIILIAIGGAVVLGIIIFLIVYCVRKQKNSKKVGLTLDQLTQQRADYYNKF